MKTIHTKKRKGALYILLLLLLTSAAQAQFRIVGYMPSWSGAATDIQYTKVTHVIYAFIRPTTTGGLTALDNASKLSSIVSLAHASGVKVSIAVGGWSDFNNADFQSMAGNASYRASFINNLVALINSYQLDGVDIDWEYPSDGADPANFATLMSELGSAMHSRGKLLTAAVSATGYYADGVQSSVFNAVDWLNLMVYDGGNGADHSPYSYAVSSLDYWAGRGLAATKASLGVPFYARPSWKSFSTLLSEGASANSDTYNGDYYNGIATIKQKTNLAFDRGLGGMMIWELSQDATGSNSLISAIKEVKDLRSGTTTPQTPYGGTVRTIPGVIEAEYYDLGGEGVAYHDLTAGNSGNAFRTDNVDVEASTDTGGGYNIGYVDAGEWLEYTINVTTAGAYTLQARVAATAAGKSFHIELNGANISGTITVPNTGGWQTWQTITVTTPALSTGQKVLRLAMDTDGYNINSITFTTTTATNALPTASITAPASNAGFTAPASVTISANASDTDGTISKVDFYAGSTLLGTDTSSPYSYTWTGVAAGTYSLTTKATDNAGGTGTSAAVSITVTGATSSCAGKAQYVENGGYVAGSQVQNFSNVYECKPYPYTGWCNGAAWAYAPGTGTYWTDAWVLVGSCSGARISTVTSAARDVLTESRGLVVYPNPAGNKDHTVTLSFDTNQDHVQFLLHDSNGATLFGNNYAHVKSTLKVELPPLAKGLYLIRIQGDKQSWSKKYLVE